MHRKVAAALALALLLPMPAVVWARGARAAPPGPCAADQLSSGPATGSGAAGTVWFTYRLQNQSAETCSLQGFPGVQLLDAQGRVLGIPTSFEGPAGTLIVLKTHAAAAFNLGATNICAPDSPWPRRPSSWLLVSFPHEGGSLLIRQDLATCRLRVQSFTPSQP